MQRKALTVLIVALCIAVAVAPALSADASNAETATPEDIPMPYEEGSLDRTFQGIAKYDGDYIPESLIGDARVVIMAAFESLTDHRWYYTTEPFTDNILSKERVESSWSGEDPIFWNFSVSIPTITDPDGVPFKYFLCVENGYKIATTPTMLGGEPVKVSPFPYETIEGAEAPWGTKRMPSYTAFKINESLYSAPSPTWVTGETKDSYHVISLMPAKVNVSGTVMSGKFLLANVNIDFCRESTPDVSQYSGTTDKNGKYYFKDVNTGTYIVKVHTNGYTAEDQVFTVTDGEVNVLNIDMTQDNVRYFGYDMPHFLLILGGIIGVILIVASLFFQYWVVRKKHDNWVYNDMTDEDEEE